jgi:D-hexose-6-phosphate mutarotase
MPNDLTTITHTASGASCQIHAVGATVTSYKSANGREHIFVSKDAIFDGSKAIRGGIPICFPIFGPPAKKESTMPQHGFAVSMHQPTRLPHPSSYLTLVDVLTYYAASQQVDPGTNF